jgi:predicted O-methyltransferase YrrM
MRTFVPVADRVDTPYHPHADSSMKLAEVTQKVAGIPYMSSEQGEVITRLILTHRLRRILELGFHHGVSTCYLAAALDELGGGRLTTIDLEEARTHTPSAEDLLTDLGLRHLVTLHYEPTSYLWRLMKMLDAEPVPQFDLAYIDGAHTWATDGFAFLLVDRLLAPGGWIVFDDLDWTFDASPAWKDTAMVRDMPIDERTTPQVRKVYELLVKTHGAYDELEVRGDWALARKSPDARTSDPPRIVTELVYETRHVGLGDAFLRVGKRLMRGR